ncbi:hypothetical protein ACIQMO_29890 [Streptomyces sp. NPDC091406]|uniref:hypothetical protein n=1 Tax=unclassified Streptomyces TaxID=2593676 RepID=UPI0037FFE122
MGGSYAGLFAARVLSDYAEEVVILEPDVIGADGIGSRVPQRHQLHALLAMGLVQLETWFPSITQELVDGGAPLGEGDDVQFYLDGRLKAPLDGARMLGATRPFLESHLRRRVMSLPNVRLLRLLARGLVFDGDQVAGVATEAPDGSSREVIDAELVIDAMGRSSRLAAWLPRHGWDSPVTERMDLDLGYATAAFERGGELGSTVIAHSSPGPASGYLPTLTEAGALAAVEGDRWSAVLAGYARDRPGSDADAFLARMRRCVAPLREVADNCAMIGDVATFHFAAGQRRSFSRLRRFPGGLIVVGDALCSVNPVYGQGLTLAALEANCLAAHLRSTTSWRNPAVGYFRRAEAVVEAAWQISSLADLAQPHVTGPYPPGYRLTRRMADMVTTASVIDPGVNSVYMDVVNLLKHPQALRSPKVIARTVRVLLAS